MLLFNCPHSAIEGRPAFLSYYRIIVQHIFRVALTVILLFSCKMENGTVAAVAKPSWQSQLDSLLPLLGHRNWIIIADEVPAAVVARNGVYQYRCRVAEWHVIRSGNWIAVRMFSQSLHG